MIKLQTGEGHSLGQILKTMSSTKAELTYQTRALALIQDSMLCNGCIAAFTNLGVQMSTKCLTLTPWNTMTLRPHLSEHKEVEDSSSLQITTDYSRILMSTNQSSSFLPPDGTQGPPSCLIPGQFWPPRHLTLLSQLPCKLSIATASEAGCSRL